MSESLRCEARVGEATPIPGGPLAELAIEASVAVPREVGVVVELHELTRRFAWALVGAAVASCDPMEGPVEVTLIDFRGDGARRALEPGPCRELLQELLAALRSAWTEDWLPHQARPEMELRWPARPGGVERLLSLETWFEQGDQRIEGRVTDAEPALAGLRERLEASLQQICARAGD